MSICSPSSAVPTPLRSPCSLGQGPLGSLLSQEGQSVPTVTHALKPPEQRRQEGSLSSAVCIQVGYTGSGFGTERQAGFPRALLTPSPAVWPWKAMCAGWRGFGWRRMCSWTDCSKAKPWGTQLQSSDQQVVLPAPKEWEGFVMGRSSGSSPGLMVECKTLNIYRSRLLRHL